MRGVAKSDSRNNCCTEDFYWRATHTCHASTRKQPFDYMDRSLLRTVINSTFYTTDHLPKKDEHLSSRCPYCGEEDSIIHRKVPSSWRGQTRLPNGHANSDFESASSLLQSWMGSSTSHLAVIPWAIRYSIKHTHIVCRGAPAKRYTWPIHWRSMLGAQRCADAPRWRA